MARPRTYVILLGAAAAAVAVVRHVGGAATGRETPRGILVGDALVYDALGWLVLGSFYRRIAADVAAVAPDGGRVLDVGCGPGHLSIRLSRHGLDVTGLDLDPAMVERARANADRKSEQRRPSFIVGDVASLAFPDGSFDLVVSTLSMHHWGDPPAGLIEIGRVLRPEGRALVWDLRPGVVPLHRDVSEPLEQMHRSPLEVIRVTRLRWPWRFELTQRIELVPRR